MKYAETRQVAYSRKTRETEISIELALYATGEISVDTEVPFFDHLLQAMAFPGRFNSKLKARGDIQVDEHHLVEDTGILFGETLNRLLQGHGPVRRCAQAAIPMDEALFKTLGVALSRAYAPAHPGGLSTKGTLD